MTSSYSRHQPARLASRTRTSTASRCSGSVIPYSMRRSLTSLSLNATRPSSSRLIFDSEARIVNPASAREIPFSSRRRRRWAPTSMRRTVTLPVAGSAMPRSALIEQRVDQDLTAREHEQDEHEEHPGEPGLDAEAATEPRADAGDHPVTAGPDEALASGRVVDAAHDRCSFLVG